MVMAVRFGWTGKGGIVRPLQRPGGAPVRVRALRGLASFDIIRSLVENDCRFKHLRQFHRVVSERYDTKKEVDELSETLHNLSSLLLTNTTIRRTQQGSTEYDL
jgi:hypothetical protein